MSDLLDCACGGTSRPPEYDPRTGRIHCPVCFSRTPPSGGSEGAATAWNAMQQAARPHGPQPGDTLKVEIPVVVYRLRDGAVRYVWGERRLADQSPQDVAAEKLGLILMDGIRTAAAYVITADLPVPQPVDTVAAEAVRVERPDMGDEG